MSSMDKAAVGWSIGIAAVAAAIAFYGAANPITDTSFDAPSLTPSEQPIRDTAGSPAPDMGAQPDDTTMADDDSTMDSDDTTMADDDSTMDSDDTTMADDDSTMDSDDTTMADDDSTMDSDDTTMADEPTTRGPVTVQVSMPMGTAVPGCEVDDTCVVPSYVEINVGDTVSWSNDDIAAHTITSGAPQGGPSGVFDSSLIMAGNVFEYTFDEAGSYQYFCLVHPWMLGMVQVN